MPAQSLLQRLRSRDAGLSIVLVLQIVTLFGAAPLAASGKLPDAAVELMRLGLAGAAVLLVTRSRLGAALVTGALLISLLVGVGGLAPRFAEDARLVRLAAAGGFDLAILIVVARVVFAAGEVTVHRILGGVIVYISIGLLFAEVYRAMALIDDAAFRGLTHRGAFGEMLYFSLSTLTTTGFGDIIPLRPTARSLANLEAVVGQLFPATLLARLVTLHAAKTTGILSAETGARPPPAADPSPVEAARPAGRGTDEAPAGERRDAGVDAAV